MMTVRGLAMVALVLILSCDGLWEVGCRHARGADRRTELLEKEANFARNRGDYAKAAAAYAELRKAAGEAGESKLVAQAILNKARLHERMAKTDRGGAKHEKLAATAYDEAIAAYKSAIDASHGRQHAADKALLQNNLATIYIKQKKASDAIEYLSKLNPEDIKAEQRYVYDYNFGRAYQLSGDSNNAFLKYREALHKNPRFATAVTRAFEVLRDSKVPQDSEKLDPFTDGPKLLTQLLEQGQVELARDTAIDQLLENDQVGASGFLTVLVQSYVQSYIDPATFRATHGRKLLLLSKTSNWSQPSKEIAKVYQEDFKPIIRKFDGNHLPSFPYWSHADRSDAQRAAFSALLQRVGDYYAQPTRSEDQPKGRVKDPRRAFTRYITAWMIDQRNTESATLAATMLRNYTKEIDPDGVYYDALSKVYLNGEKTSYQLNYRRIEDWENVRAMHYILSGMFPVEKSSKSILEPRSAVFQLSLAAYAERRLAHLATEQKVRFRPNPTINMEFALALEHSQQTELKAMAATYYLYAGTEFTKRKSPAEAAAAFAAAQRLKPGIRYHAGEVIASFPMDAFGEGREVRTGDVPAKKEDR